MAEKRGNGEGNVRERKNGLWEGRVLIEGRWKSVYAKTKEDARRSLNKVIRAHEQGLPIVANERQTLEVYLMDWLSVIRHKVRASTYRRYGDYIRIHLIPVLGRHRLTKLTPQQVEAFYRVKLDEGLSATTVHNIHGMLHHALDRAVRQNLVQRNVTDLVDAPARESPEQQTMSEEQANRFLAAAEGDRFYALYVLALMTGMRQGELLGLRWSDLNLEGGYLQVRMAVQETYGKKFILADPKTPHSKRRISLTPEAIQALRDHRMRQAEERRLLGEAWDTRLDLVFPNAIGGLMIPHNLSKRGFKPILEKAGLPDFKFHCLRHTAATMLLNRGVFVKVVSKILGHSDITTTLRIYAHVTQDMQQAAVRAMEDIFIRTTRKDADPSEVEPTERTDGAGGAIG